METASQTTKNLIPPFRGVNTEEARLARLEFLKDLGMNTSSFKESKLDASSVKSNIENFIGTLNIPLGLVGPIVFQNENNEKEFAFTMAATTEGALVASMNRGASIISACGGFRAYVNKQRMLRAPMFCFENVYEAKEFSHWLKKQKSLLNEHITKYSQRAKLVEIKTNVLGRNVDCKFYFETADASGQNMTTICTWHSCLWIEDKFNSEHNFKISEFVLEGNGASDKKLSYSSIINGRGIDVVAECVIPEEILNKRLKVTSEKMLKWFNISYQLTSHDGMVGNNINVSNAIASIFAATGQDLACVVESAIGFLSMEPHPEGLYMSLKLPNLVVGSVGGGTGLLNQKAILELMGCYGTGKVEKFAKLIAGFALGLELSTMSAMVSGQFAIAHERLGRNKSVDFFKKEELNTAFFIENNLVKKHEYIHLVDNLSDNNGIITSLTAENTSKYIGLSLWSIEDRGEHEFALLKSKPTDKETLNCMYILTGMLDPALAKSFMKYQDKSDFMNCHTKELFLYDFFKENDSPGVPKVFGTYENNEREAYFLFMEFFQENHMRVFNSELKIHLWTNKEILEATKVITKLHFDLDQVKELNKNIVFTAFKDYKEFLSHSIDVITIEYGKKYAQMIALFKNCSSYLEQNEERILKVLPTHIVHNDFNPRNIAITNKGEFKIYDWELAGIDLPHRDIIELLCFTHNSENISLPILELLKGHHQEYMNEQPEKIEFDLWFDGYKYAFSKFICNRVNFYMLGSRISQYPFLGQLLKNLIKIDNEVFKLC